jgi:transcriptional regulator of acetoin/glycerol metabolism
LKLTPACRAIILQHAFPGNLRELKSVVEFLDIAADDIAAPEHLPASLKPVFDCDALVGEMPERLIAAAEGKPLKESVGAFEDFII